MVFPESGAIDTLDKCISGPDAVEDRARAHFKMRGPSAAESKRSGAEAERSAAEAERSAAESTGQMRKSAQDQ